MIKKFLNIKFLAVKFQFNIFQRLFKENGFLFQFCPSASMGSGGIFNSILKDTAKNCLLRNISKLINCNSSKLIVNYLCLMINFMEDFMKNTIILATVAFLFCITNVLYLWTCKIPNYTKVQKEDPIIVLTTYSPKGGWYPSITLTNCNKPWMKPVQCIAKVNPGLGQADVSPTGPASSFTIKFRWVTEK
jgi:hypothetical protein